MTLAAQKISAEALADMLEMFAVQPWLQTLHAEMAELWSLCQSREEQILLKTLLSKFYILDSAKEHAACRGIAEKIIEWGLVHTDTWIVATANREEIDGSTAGLQKLKNKMQPIESWHARMISNIPAAVDKIKSGDNVLLFDDFIGSGGKMITKKEWLIRLLVKEGVVGNKFFYVGFTGMRFGVEHIKAATGESVFVHHALLKGISESYPAVEAAGMKSLMLQLESRLGKTYRNKKLVDYSLGYGKSEALYCGQNDNCPNNVFPILWWPTRGDGGYGKTVLVRAG